MANYFDKIQYLHPGIQHVVYWKTQYNGQPWDNDYDGIKWNNKEIEKPSQDVLDKLDDATVDAELSRRYEIQRKSYRDANCKSNLALVAAYTQAQKENPVIGFTEYLDSLEAIASKL